MHEPKVETTPNKGSSSMVLWTYDNIPELRCTDTLSCFWAMFRKGNSLCDFQFTSLHEVALLKWGLLFKERICSIRSKFFALRDDPNL